MEQKMRAIIIYDHRLILSRTLRARIPQKGDAAAVPFRQRQQRVLIIIPRSAGRRVVGEEPKHGQIGLQVGVKVGLVGHTQQRQLKWGRVGDISQE